MELRIKFNFDALKIRNYIVNNSVPTARGEEMP